MKRENIETLFRFILVMIAFLVGVIFGMILILANL